MLAVASAIGSAGYPCTSRAVALLTSCFAIAEVPAFGATVRFRTDAELVALSERVVHARAIAQRTERGPLDPRTIYTVTTFEVIEDFTGHHPDVIDVWELGGVIGNEFMSWGSRRLPRWRRAARLPRAWSIRSAQCRYGILRVRRAAHDWRG